MKKLLCLLFISLFYCNLLCANIVHADITVTDTFPLQGDFDEVMPWVNDPSISINEYANRRTPLFAGDQVDESFGKSQYDEGIPWMQLQSESLNDIRAENEKAQKESIINNIVIGLALITLIILLLKMSQKK